MKKYSLKSNLVLKVQKWYNNLWFMQLSRKIASRWYQAMRRGIDFGDMSFKDFVKYYCRDNTKHQWYRFFVNYKEIDKELNRYYELEYYE